MARSNRQLTQFAVDNLRRYMDEPLLGVVAAGNTKVRAERRWGSDLRWSVELFDEEILAVVYDSLGYSIEVFAGNFYDSKGRPSRTTRERLNGLLDFLCSRQLLPEGVRVFIREDGACCLGNGDDHYILDESNPSWRIRSTPAKVLGLEPLINPLLVRSIPDSIIAKGLV